MMTMPSRSPRSTAWNACCTRSRSPASTARASTSTGRWATPSMGNLLEPGDTPHENAQFLVFCAAVIRAVHKYAPVAASRWPSATTTIDSAPTKRRPAIISIFLGDQLTDVFEQIEKGAATVVEGQGHDDRSASTPCRLCRGSPATATAPARLPSRATSLSSAPSARVSPLRSADGPQHDRGRLVRLHRHRSWRRRSRTARTSTRPCRSCSPTSSRSTVR